MKARSEMYHRKQEVEQRKGPQRAGEGASDRKSVGWWGRLLDKGRSGRGLEELFISWRLLQSEFPLSRAPRWCAAGYAKAKTKWCVAVEFMLAGS